MKYLFLFLFLSLATATTIIQDGQVTTAKLNDSVFHGLTGVTPVAADYVPIADASDSNKKKKASVAAFRNATYRSVTTTDSVGVDDEYMKLSGSSFTSTLPTAVGVEGKRYKFHHAGTSQTNVYTLATTSAQTIGGVASGSYALYTNGEFLDLVSDGANWQIVNHRAETDWISGGANTITGVSSNPTKGTPSIDAVYYRRNGKNAEVRIAYTQSGTGGAAGSGDYKFLLPLTADTTTITADATSSLTNYNSFANSLGVCFCKGGNSFIPAVAVLYDSTHVRCSGMLNGSANATWGSSLCQLNSLISGGFTISYPVSGWQP